MDNVVYAIDCGGTNLRVAAIDSKLSVISFKTISTITDNPNNLYNKIKEFINDIHQETKIPVKNIGFSICGVVSNNNVGRCGNIGIEEGFDFYSKLKKDFPEAKITIANDANASALGEAVYGVNKDYNDSIFITISTGIGMGVVLNKKIVDTPMELGRQLIKINNIENELEYFLSGTGIVNLSREFGLKVKDAKEFFELVKNKEKNALVPFNEWINNIALMLVNLQLLFNVEGYSLSGGVIKSASVYFNEIEKIANSKIAKWHLRKIKLHVSQFDQNIGIISAGALALTNL